MSTRNRETSGQKRLLELLGKKPADIRKNFHTLVFGSLYMLAQPELLKAAGGRAIYAPSSEYSFFPSPLPELFEAYAAAVLEAPPWTDVLSEIHCCLLAAKGGEGLGQYFTPWDLANLVGKIGRGLTNRSKVSLKGSDGLLHIHEPNVGAGSLLLGQLRVGHGKGIGPGEVSIDAWDIDPLCCAMTALQLRMSEVFFRQPIGQVIVREGNTLTLSNKVVWFSESLTVKRTVTVGTQEWAMAEIMGRCAA